MKTIWKALKPVASQNGSFLEATGCHASSSAVSGDWFVTVDLPTSTCPLGHWRFLRFGFRVLPLDIALAPQDLLNQPATHHFVKVILFYMIQIKKTLIISDGFWSRHAVCCMSHPPTACLFWPQLELLRSVAPVAVYTWIQHFLFFVDIMSSPAVFTNMSSYQWLGK